VLPGTTTLTVEISTAGGGLVSDTQTVQVLAAAGDNEPNDDTSTASRITRTSPVAGHLAPPSDPRDTFTFETTTDGTLRLTLGLSDPAAAAGMSVILYDGAGNVIGTFTPSGAQSNFQQTATAGTFFVSVQTSGIAADYRLSQDIGQAPVAITSI